jgi:hypothetical protein
LKFVKIGNHIINLGLITQIEIDESGDGINILFSGSSDALRLNGTAGKALLAAINLEGFSSPH